VVIIKDYLTLKSKDLQTGTETAIDMPKSDVLQFFLEDGSKISVRPSGTEPKIKFYFGVKGELKAGDDFKKTEAVLDGKIAEIISSLGLK